MTTITDKIKNTSEITRESNKVIIEIIGGISDIAGSMKETLLGLKEISTGNKQITDSLVILNNLTGEVMNFSREMCKGTAGNEASIQYIYKIADKTRNGISEINIGLMEISKTINILLELSLDNSKNIQILDGEMAKFKT